MLKFFSHFPQGLYQMFPFCHAALPVVMQAVTHSTENSEVVSRVEVPYVILFTQFLEVQCSCLNEVKL